MNHLNKDYYFRFFQNLRLILIFFLVILFSCRQKHEPEIAQINDDIITLNEYLSRYQNFLSKTHQDDNLLNRYNLLNLLIDEAIIMEYAKETGILEKIEKLPQSISDKNQLLLNTLYKQEIGHKLIAEEIELRRLYTWSKSSIHIRHLFSRTKQGILDIKNKLNSGHSWEKLALSCFNDPLLSLNGGDLGFKKLGELDPAFEEVAFQLHEGEISPPVMTGDGYSIIQLIEREYSPFFIENEYLKIKERLDIIAKNYKKRPAVRKYTDKILTKLELQFFDEAIKSLIPLVLSLNNKNIEIPFNNSNTQCIYSNSLNKIWNVGQALDICRTLSDKQKKRFNSIENAKSILSGLLVREELLKIAIEIGLNTEDAFVSINNSLKKSHIIKYLLDNIINVEVINKETLITFQSFLGNLRSDSQIIIDSSLVKSFILNERI